MNFLVDILASESNVVTMEKNETFRQSINGKCRIIFSPPLSSDIYQRQNEQQAGINDIDQEANRVYIDLKVKSALSLTLQQR